MSLIGDLVNELACKYQVDPKLVAAIIVQESSGNRWATRVEEAFYSKYLKPKLRSQLAGHVPSMIPTLSTEKWNRATSFGLCQIMGDTARVLGFDGQFLAEIYDERINIDLCCRFLYKAYGQFAAYQEPVKTEKVLLAYNGGGALNYPTLIRNHISSGRAALLLGN